MSQNDKENEIKIKLETETVREPVEEPVSQNLDMSGIQDRLPNFEVPKVDDIPSSTSSGGGYNPNFKMPQNNEIEMPRPASDVPSSPPSQNSGVQNKQPGAGAPSVPPVNRNEGAPDLGKDYGKGVGAPGYGDTPSEQNRGGAVPSEELPERKNPVDNPVSNQVPDAQHRGLDKKDGLDQNDGSGLNKDKKDDGKVDSQAKTKEDSSAPSDNGYGALKNKPATNQQDSTSRARRNLEHNNTFHH